MIKISGPVWIDGCKHKEDEYIGSIEVFHSLTNFRNYDVYLIPDKCHGTHVCIRYGNENHEYISPGSLLSMCNTGGALNEEVYLSAMKLIESQTIIKWEKKNVE